MADKIVPFPDSTARTDLEIRADIADELVKHGIAGSLAIKRAAKIVEEFREFESAMNFQSVEVTNRIDDESGIAITNLIDGGGERIPLTAEETRLIVEASTKILEQAKNAWLMQRLQMEFRGRSGPGNAA